MRTETEITFKVLDDNDYEYSYGVVEDIIRKSKLAKADLIAKMRLMPGWNEEMQAVIFNKDIDRSIDMRSCYDVFSWMENKLIDLLPKKELAFSNREVNQAVDRLSSKVDYYSALIRMGEPLKERFNEVNKECNRFMAMQSWYRNETFSYNGKTISEESSKTIENFRSVSKYLKANLEKNESLLTEDYANKINEIYPEIKAVKGQKVSRVFGKICKLLGLDKVKEVRADYNGREKDYGYNYQFAKFGDAANPLHVPRYVILSVNFVDFLYMSNGNSWGSCHTIIDGGAWGYRGEYSSGTISYALDPCSMIFYTVDREYDGDEFCLQPKQQRAVFAYKDGVLYEGRVYPDGRDGGDQGYAAQFRAIVQKLFADVEDKANLWTKKAECSNYIYDLGGTAYPDWIHYPDCNISTLNEVDTTGKIIGINAEPICIDCGNKHHCAENINCCEEGDCCPECGDHVREDDGVWAGDNHYCCADCAERAGYHWCEDAYEWIYEDDCYEDSYTGDFFYHTEDMVETEDGNYYSCYENAESDGYRETDDGYWYPEDEVYCDKYTGQYFHASSSDEVFEFNGNYYRTLENAKANGEEVDEEEVAS